MKESISFKWVVVFFFIGALLAGVALLVMRGHAPAISEPVALSALPGSEQPGAAIEKERAAAPRVVARRTPPTAPPAVAAASVPEVLVPTDEREVTTATVEPLRCDRETAAKVREKAREAAEILNEGPLLKVRLRGEWDYYSDSVRRSFVAKFTDSDSCLNGQSRPIDFYYQGRLYAHADPDKGIEFQ